jgi:3-deoxy-D-manno-octulosonic-acid transferase
VKPDTDLAKHSTGVAPDAALASLGPNGWRERLALGWYSAVLWLAQPLLRRKLQQRAHQEPLYAQDVEQRFGHYDALQAAPAPGTWVWIHAVSLGETHAAAALLQQLRLALPGMRLLLTHGTATGREAGGSLLQPGDVQVWQPWDTSGATRRFVQHFRPRIGLLIETEVWPNLVRACSQAGVPLCLVNARLSAKSLRQSQRLAWLALPAFRALAAIWPQTEDDAQRLRLLGAAVQPPLGNLKFDTTPNADQCAQGQALRHGAGKPVLLFASSREGEEQMLIDAIRTHALEAPGDTSHGLPDAKAALADAIQRVQWLLVPRHPQRFDAVQALCESAGLSVSRRSADGTGFAPADIWLGDSLGEMALYLGLADVALLGGSYAPLGGQNLIEAAACGCPVVMGPYTFNFAHVAEIAQCEGAAFAVPSMAHGLERALQLVQDPAALQAASSAALAFALRHTGAARRTSLHIVKLLEHGG